MSTAAILPTRDPEDLLKQVDIGELAEIDPPLFKRFSNLLELTRSFEFYPQEYQNRIQAFARLLIRVVTPRGMKIPDDLHQRAQSYFDTAESHILRMDKDGLVGSEREEREEEIVLNLHRGNLYLIETYMESVPTTEETRTGTTDAEVELDVLLAEAHQYIDAALEKDQSEERRRELKSSHTICQELRLALFSGGPAEKERVSALTIDLSLFLGGDEFTEFDLEEIESALVSFVRALGATQPTVLRTEHGSFWRRFVSFFQSNTTKEEARQFFEDGKEALRQAAIERPRSEAIGNMADAASKLLGALDSHDNASIRVGEIILVKRTVDGRSQVAIETISPDVARKLEREPALLKDPKRLLPLIGAQEVTSDSHVERIESE